MAAALTGPAYNAKFDANRTPSLTAVSGTAGTSDTTGTAEVIRVGANPATGAMYVEDLSGASGTTNVSVLNGTLQNSGTTTGVGVVSNLTNGSINLLTGTLTRASNVGTIESGTITPNLAIDRGTLGTFTAAGQTIDISADGAGLISFYTRSTSWNGTISFFATHDDSNWLPIEVGRYDGNGGQIRVLAGAVSDNFYVRSAGFSQIRGSCDAYTAGSMAFQMIANQSDGGAWPTLAIGDGNVTLDANIDKSILVGGIDPASGGQFLRMDNTGRILLGTSANNIGDMDIATGTVTLVSTLTTLSNLTNGSVNILTGTLQSSGTTTGVGVVSNLTNGSVNILTGTLQSSGTTTGVGVVSNLTNGSVNVLTGTVTSVTNLADGTVHIDNLPVRLGTAFTTYGTTGAAVWGTIIAASGAGTKQYVENLDIVVHSGTVDVAVTNIGIGGSTGAGVLARGQFPPGGGIQRSFFPPVASGANGTLSYWLGGAGTASIDIVYWQGV